MANSAGVGGFIGLSVMHDQSELHPSGKTGKIRAKTEIFMHKAIIAAAGVFDCEVFPFHSVEPSLPIAPGVGSRALGQY